jgi:hypothetical protein
VHEVDFSFFSGPVQPFFLGFLHRTHHGTNNGYFSAEISTQEKHIVGTT